MKIKEFKGIIAFWLLMLVTLNACKRVEEQPTKIADSAIEGGKKLNAGVSAIIANPGTISQKLEAEKATLSNGAASKTDANRSGGAYVAQSDGNLSFTISIPETKFYNIYLNAAAPGGKKTNNLLIDGKSSFFTIDYSTSYNNYRLATCYKLTAGTHTIAITKNWGWLNIDYLALEITDPATRFNINTSLVTPTPMTQANNVYQFLRTNYGKKIISGVMTLSSFDETNWLKEKTGKEPVIMGVDFMHCNRGYTWYDNDEPRKNAKTWWDKNGIPTMMWHWRDPSKKTEEFYSSKTTFDVSKISDSNSAEYKAMLSDIDYVSGQLKTLQQQGVPVIWRPLHEAAGGWFWWGAKGAAPCKKLWQIMFDRMVNYHGLKNLIWVWTREPDDEAWYPGDQYVDIIGRDLYAPQGDHSSHSIEFNNISALYGGKKMITLSECGGIPDPDNLVSDAVYWSWFMPWYGSHTRDEVVNPINLWKKIMNHSSVITLDEMSSLK